MISKIAIHGDQGINVTSAPSQFLTCFHGVWFGELLGKNILSSEAYDNRYIQCLPDRPSQSRKQHIREMNDVDFRHPREEVEQFRQLLALPARFTAQHGNGEGAKLRRVGLAAPATEPIDQPRTVEKPVDESGCLSEEAILLLEEDIQATKCKTFLPDRFFVGTNRRVERHEHDIVASLNQGASQSVAVHATPAVHPARTGNEVDDTQWSGRGHWSAKCDIRGFGGWTRPFNIQGREFRDRGSCPSVAKNGVDEVVEQ